jgi:hypothetical protein
VGFGELNATPYDDTNTAEHLAAECLREAKRENLSEADVISAAGSGLAAFMLTELNRAVDPRLTTGLHGTRADGHPRNAHWITMTRRESLSDFTSRLLGVAVRSTGLTSGLARGIQGHPPPEAVSRTRREGQMSLCHRPVRPKTPDPRFANRGLKPQMLGSGMGPTQMSKWRISANDLA